MGIEGPILNCGSCLCEGGWRRHHLRSRLHGHGHTFTGMRTPSWSLARTVKAMHTRPCSHLHAHTFTGMRISARPWRKPIRRDQRTAQQIPNQPCLTNTLNLRYSPADQSSIQPTQNAWGAWATTTLRRLRRQGGQHACVIGPKGPIVVGPDGPTDSRA